MSCVSVIVMKGLQKDCLEKPYQFSSNFSVFAVSEFQRILYQHFKIKLFPNTIQ